jgi:hypothetical protein
MSYDLEIGTHRQPHRAQVEAWAAEQGLGVDGSAEPGALTIERAGKRGHDHVCTVDGPYPAEPEDFAEEIAAACLAPKWMVQISVPYSSPQVNFSRARSLARHIAEQNEGAAFDPQEDRLLWPRGRPKRVPKVADEVTSRIGLEWFLPPDRWPDAAQMLIGIVARRCPEALPTRFGQYEPLPHRFDLDKANEFVRFLLDNDDGDAFWHARSPSFGGSCFAPHAEKWAPADDDHLRIGHIELDFDGRVLGADARWREAIVDLFVAAATQFGAFYAAAQVEPGWQVTRNNRLFATAATLPGEHFLRGRLWQGLPPVPVWLSWFGPAYKDLVASALLPDSLGVSASRPSLRSRIFNRARHPQATPTATEVDGGILLRLSEQPLDPERLPGVSLPTDLTYTRRPPTKHPDGAVSWNPAEREDQAQLIPPLAGAVG